MEANTFILAQTKSLSYFAKSIQKSFNLYSFLLFRQRFCLLSYKKVGL